MRGMCGIAGDPRVHRGLWHPWDAVSFGSRLPDSRRDWHMRRKQLLKRASRGLVAGPAQSHLKLAA